MVAINFTVFQDKILSGEKRQTVRLKARCKPGDRCGLRYFSAERFRKINGLDISEGLAKVMAICVPSDEKAAA